MNIILNNGEMVNIFSLDQFRDLIEDELGEDALRIYDKLTENELGNIRDLQEEYDGQCESTDNLVSALMNAQFDLKKVIDDLYTTNRINRKKLIEDLESINRTIDLDNIDY